MKKGPFSLDFKVLTIIAIAAFAPPAIFLHAEHVPQQSSGNSFSSAPLYANDSRFLKSESGISYNSIRDKYLIAQADTDRTVEDATQKDRPGTVEQKKGETAGKKAASKVRGKGEDTGPRSMLLNFNNVEISEFLNVMGQLIGKNILIDDKVKGKITISSSRKIPVAKAVDIMKAVLEIKGLAVVEAENFVKVVPVQDAVKETVKVIIDKKGEVSLDQENLITYLYQFKNADVNEVSKVFNSLKSRYTDVVTYQPENMIIMRGEAQDINGLMKIAKTLDVFTYGPEDKKDKQPKGNIHVIHLEHADATELAAVLSRVPFSDTAKIDSSPVAAPQQQPQQQPTQETPALYSHQSIADARARKKTGDTRTTDLQKSTSKLSIIANKETNSLIVAAKPDEFREIDKLVKELDIVRQQVYIESLIVEVSADSSWGFGIDWMLGNQSGSHLYGGSSIMGSLPDYTVPSSLSGKKLAVPLSTGFQLGYLADRSVLGYVLLNASGTDKNFNVLSTPQVLAIDNNESEINVGSEIPVVANNRISDTGTQFYTYEYKTVGVKFKVKPHITKNQSITLDLFLEVNSVLDSTSTATTTSYVPPRLGRRDFKTKITVNDGKTIVVGGLIRDEKTVTETKLPFLGDIPLLGWFFKHKSYSDSKTNLLVFITPSIVTKSLKLEAMTEQKREEQRRLKMRRK